MKPTGATWGNQMASNKATITDCPMGMQHRRGAAAWPMVTITLYADLGAAPGSLPEAHKADKLGFTGEYLRTP